MLLENDYFEKSGIKFLKEFLPTFKNDLNVLHFIPIEVKNEFNKWVLRTGFSIDYKN